jgi:hypothetical protein
MPLPIIITTPNYALGNGLKLSAPAGISVAVGYQAYAPNPENTPAVALVVFDVVTPCNVSREQFVNWLLSQTTKNDGYSLTYDGIIIEKTASAFARVFEDMEKHKNDPVNPDEVA